MLSYPQAAAATAAAANRSASPTAAGTLRGTRSVGDARPTDREPTEPANNETYLLLYGR